MKHPFAIVSLGSTLILTLSSVEMPASRAADPPKTAVEKPSTDATTVRGFASGDSQRQGADPAEAEADRLHKKRLTGRRKESVDKDLELALPDLHKREAELAKDAAKEAAAVPTDADVIAALQTYDVESLQKRIEKMPPGTQWHVYMHALGAVRNPQRLGEIYVLHGLAEMYETSSNPDKSHASMKYSGALQRIMNGTLSNPGIFEQQAFRAAVVRVFGKCGMSEQLANDFVDRGAKHMPINLSDYNPAARN